MKGYFNFEDVVHDLNEIVDVLWLSGTRECFSVWRLFEIQDILAGSQY